MDDIAVRDFGFFESIRRNERGVPEGGTQLTDGVIPPNLDRVIAYFRITGKPGSYWLAIDVKHETEEPNLSISVPSEYVAIPIGGDAHLTVPISIGSMPRGHYVFTITLANRRIGKFGFTIE